MLCSYTSSLSTYDSAKLNVVAFKGASAEQPNAVNDELIKARKEIADLRDALADEKKKAAEYRERVRAVYSKRDFQGKVSEWDAEIQKNSMELSLREASELRKRNSALEEKIRSKEAEILRLQTLSRDREDEFKGIKNDVLIEKDLLKARYENKLSMNNLKEMWPVKYGNGAHKRTEDGMPEQEWSRKVLSLRSEIEKVRKSIHETLKKKVDSESKN